MSQGRAILVAAGVVLGVLLLGAAVLGITSALQPQPAAPPSRPPASARPTATPTPTPTPSPAPAVVQRCRTDASGDTDGDGRDDPVVGAPGEDEASGAVILFRGGGDGIVPGERLYQGRDGMPGSSEPGARFGSGVALGDVDGDGCADAVVAAPGSTVGVAGDLVERGTLTLLYGEPDAGLTVERADAVDAVELRLESPSAQASVRAIESAVLGDVDGDGFDDLALVARVEGADVRREVHLVPGSAEGPDASGVRRVAVPALDGPVETVRLAAGDVQGDGYGDLVVAAGGLVEIVPGTAVGLDVARTARIAGDGALAVPVLGDFDGDGRDDLAVGRPNADLVTVHLGGVGEAARTVRPGADGVTGPVGGGFGRALAAGDFNGDGDVDLAVSGGTGALWVLPGAAPAGALVQETLPEPFAGGAPAAAGGTLFAGLLGRGLGADLLIGNAEAYGGAGAVLQVFGSEGSEAGLVPEVAVVLTQDDEAVPGTREAGDGWAVLPSG